MGKKKNVNAPDAIADGALKPLKLDYSQTIKVGLAFAIIMIFWNVYDFVVPLLLEQAYGLSNSMRGLVMGLDNLLSLFMLPLFGRLSDKAHGKFIDKFGKRTPFIICGTVLAVIMMVFIPFSAQSQLETSTDVRASYEAQLNNDDFMEERLNDFYGDSVYFDKVYIEAQGVSQEEYLSIRYDAKMVAKSGFLGMGGTSYLYDGNEVALTDSVQVSYVDSNGNPATEQRLVQDILDGNENYNLYVKTGMNVYLSEVVESQVLSSEAGVRSLSIYMVVLFFVLMAMATFRSPAVALMPDVTPKPLRSQANAMINLMGGVGGALGFLIYTIVLFGDNKFNYVIIYGCVAAIMLLLLGAYLILVKERKLVEKCAKTCEEYGITDEEVDAQAIADSMDGEAEILDGEVQETESEALPMNSIEKRNKKIHDKFQAKYAGLSEEQKFEKLKKAKQASFLLILASIFMWFMGYNAVTTNLSIYCVKTLNIGAGVAGIISGVSMGISAIAFIPVGILAVKIGRRKSVMIGFSLAAISFVLIFTPLIKMAGAEVARAALFAVFYLIAGFGLIIANVNTFPMVTELSTAKTLGQYTGYYYVATMSAQAITPFIAGLIMDASGANTLFIYAAACVVVAIGLMAIVKYGDSIQIPKGKKMTKEEKKQAALNAIDND